MSDYAALWFTKDVDDHFTCYREIREVNWNLDNKLFSILLELYRMREEKYKKCQQDPLSGR